MNINRKQSLKFSARNPEIRRADQIMRQAMNNYPAISSSKIKHYDVVKKDYLKSLKSITCYDKLFKLRIARLGLDTKYEIEQILKDTKKYHNANCTELSYIALAAFLANGYKDLKLASLSLEKNRTNIFKFSKKEEKDIDHVVLIVNAGEGVKFDDMKTFNKHTMIVDPWRGFVDYIHNGLTRYDSIFLDGLRNQKGFWSNLKQRIKLELYRNSFPASDDCNCFALKYPEFIIKK